jgi:hypothetical protein
MTAKLYAFPSGEQIRRPRMSGEFYVCAIVATFFVVALLVTWRTR